ncbi:MAG TPA: tetratricopeptide repeat protein [Rhizomicrobium sp.]
MLFWTLFAVIALAAIAFAVAPIIRTRKKGHVLLAAAIALFMLGVGFGVYLMLGSPALAVRSLAGIDSGQVNALIPPLIERTRKAPGDVRAWDYLGRVYLAAGDADDAAKAFARAVTLARLDHTPSAELYSAYGEALVKVQGGAVGDDARAAFIAALTLNHKDDAARYYLGLAAAMQGDPARAAALWQNLLADLPPNAPQRAELVDRLAALGGAPPNIQAMVDGLAARLKQNPDDAEGWQRLIHAYAVLGEKDKALAALAVARKSLPPTMQATLTAEAASLNLHN